MIFSNQELKKFSNTYQHMYILVLRFMKEYLMNFNQPFGLDNYDDIKVMKTYMQYMREHPNNPDVHLWP